MGLGQHIVLRPADGRVIAPAPLERRRVARAVLELARNDELLAFGLADTHLHMLCGRDARAASELARRVEISLVQRLALDVRFVPAYVKPIHDNGHLYRAFTYVLEQSPHHGLQWDPLHEASSLPDLLGLRVLGTYTAATVRRRLPRITRADLLACMGIDELQPLDGPLDLLMWATLAAAGLPGLEGKHRERGDARRALVQVAGPRVTATELAALLRVSARTVHDLRHRPADRPLLHAIRLQLGLMRRRSEEIKRRELPFVEPPGVR